MVRLEQARKKDFRETAQGFGVCTAAVIILYLISGMDAVNMREMHLSLLMALLTACCAFYVTSAFSFFPSASVITDTITVPRPAHKSTLSMIEMHGSVFLPHALKESLKIRK